MSSTSTPQQPPPTTTTVGQPGRHSRSPHESLGEVCWGRWTRTLLDGQSNNPGTCQGIQLVQLPSEAMAEMARDNPMLLAERGISWSEGMRVYQIVPGMPWPDVRAGRSPIGAKTANANANANANASAANANASPARTAGSMTTTTTSVKQHNGALVTTTTTTTTTNPAKSSKTNAEAPSSTADLKPVQGHERVYGRRQYCTQCGQSEGAPAMATGLQIVVAGSEASSARALLVDPAPAEVLLADVMLPALVNGVRLSLTSVHPPKPPPVLGVPTPKGFSMLHVSWLKEHLGHPETGLVDLTEQDGHPSHTVQRPNDHATARTQSLPPMWPVPQQERPQVPYESPLKRLRDFHRAAWEHHKRAMAEWQVIVPKLTDRIWQGTDWKVVLPRLSEGVTAIAEDIWDRVRSGK
ncbi:hypothetical protein CAOG_07246 [Capsaspora owczarzaki ATCC 30864]|uniref:Uncharacterized protein n=1 Tax=Capsaspora owczarzaki (strain ATCC 30864) TaxID=595528 RepID=A0A0D2WWL0_CAPO3|nr:hypothetical protein CAOG_07246 [Capsaspora owczarzaki ATCC 30864]KJE97375.1 hypothetical protein CAOG_007246 [Capsaspora owczarzaki ATCC 30864]|eukprot:XP_004343105.1 hypothetical protein CAOG_07246 [Capsaspora owczarzaki ATCC 30864]